VSFKPGDMVRVTKQPQWAQDLVGQLGIVTHIEKPLEESPRELVYVSLLKNANWNMARGYLSKQLKAVK
jgi:hypothetical protein